MFTAVDAALARMSAVSVSELDDLPLPDLAGGTTNDVQQWCRWLDTVWAHETIAQAIELASPVLAARVRELRAGHLAVPHQARRVVMSVLRYVLRISSRATPFGLFAGVAPVRFGPLLVITNGDDHHAVARIDSEWLANVITRLERCPELLRRVPVVVNNLAFVRDERLVIPFNQQPAEPDRTAPAEVTVRHTRAVATVLRAAGSPISVDDLAGKLIAAFPETPVPVIEGMLAELVTHRVLVTSLRPPMTTTDPLGHLMTALTAASADEVREVTPLLQQLRDVDAELTWHNRCRPPTTAQAVRTAAARRLTTIAPAEQPLTVDLQLDCGMVLPPTVAGEVEAAASVLARLTPHPYGPPAWVDYHARFLERYGIGALVPVRDIVDPDTGLGFPAGYRDSRIPMPITGLTERDTKLMALAQNAALDCTREVVLDDQAITDLMVDGAATIRPQPHTELCVRLHAPTRDATTRGQFDLAVVGVSRAAGTMTGRFLDLLEPPDRDRMTGAYAHLPTANDGALLAQVSGPPLYLRTENIARTSTVLPNTISLGEHPHDGDANAVIHRLPVHDLAVGGDAHRLYLISVSRRQLVEPTVFSAVEFTRRAHPLLRFLCEISTGRLGMCVPFSWGAAARLPFLPRLRYRRTILSSARWTLTAADLPRRDVPSRQWTDSFALWRRRFHVPRDAYLGDDRGLRLDLDESAHLHLLRSDVSRTGQLVLHEAPDTAAFGWLDGRAHEIVIPLIATQPARPAVSQRSLPLHLIDAGQSHLPGSGEWLFVKLYGHPDRHNTILATHLPDLLSQMDGSPEWWFLRYRDPDDHLRLRFRLRTPEGFSQIAQRVNSWAANLRRRGLIGRVQFDTYYPETGRFGDGVAMATAETVFAADSAAAIAQLTHTNTARRDAVTAASLVDLAMSFTGSIADGTRWLIDHVEKISTPALSRDLRDHAFHLADPRGQWAALRAESGGVDIAAAWTRRRQALATYRETLIRTSDVISESVLSALLHLHCIRMNGIAPETERACHRLARAAALTWRARVDEHRDQ